MNRLPLVLLLCTSLGAPALGAARAERTWTGPPPVRLVAPAAGDVLVAGSRALVEWEPVDDARFAALGFEEWEAFLSFSGGDYYAVRVTPHLDLALRRFSFQVPAVPAERARILLRFGDEVEETGFETPGLFSIVLADGAVAGRPVAGPRLPPTTAAGRGEAARPGEPGVIAWVEGTRSGEGLVLRRAARRQAHAGDRSLARGQAGSPPVVLPLRNGLERPAAAHGSGSRILPTAARAAPRRGAERAARIPILQLTDRRNE